MKRDQFCVTDNTSIQEVMKKINNHGKGMAVVEDANKKYIGVVTDGDIRRAIIKGIEYYNPISKIVNTKTVIGFDSDARENLIKLLSQEIKAIPILDKNGTMVDIIEFSKHYIPVAKPSLDGNELRYVTDCVVSNWISSQGEYIDKFEKSFTEFSGAKYALAVSNGTVALHLSLLALNIQANDEVIVPSFTWVSTVAAVRYVGAKPVFIDCENDTLNIDPKLIRSAITKNTKAIIPVHIFGQPARMGKIKNICAEKGIKIIEDAAEAHGAEYENKIVGTIGDIGIFSFFGNKIITTGEGGMLITDNFDLYEKMKILRDHGKSKKDPYWHDVIGYNYRMTNMQAAVGFAQMERIDKILNDKKRIVKQYIDQLGNNNNLIMPPVNSWSKNIHWLFCIRINSKMETASLRKFRDNIIKKLNELSIDARKFFNPIHRMPPYQASIEKLLPVCERISASGISLPAYYGMKTEDILRICNEINKVFD
jgi:perosamine synthetase